MDVQQVSDLSYFLGYLEGLERASAFITIEGTECAAYPKTYIMRILALGKQLGQNRTDILKEAKERCQTLTSNPPKS